MYLSLISLLVSVVSLAFSVYVFLKNKLYSNISIENQLFENINSAISAYRKTCSDYAVFQNGYDELSVTIKDDFLSAIDSVLSAYDFACMQYDTTGIDTNRFIDLYLSDIKTFLKENRFKEMFEGSSKYTYLKEFIASH